MSSLLGELYIIGFGYGFVALGLKIAKGDEPEEYSENILISTYDTLAMTPAQRTGEAIINVIAQSSLFSF